MCDTTAVWKDRTYKPKKGGVIFYNSKGSILDSEAVQKRRFDAKLKMKNFCQPKKAQIVSESQKEEVVGYQTYYNSLADNPNPSYHEEVRATKNVFVKSAESTVKGILMSQTTKTEQAITRNRIYVHFVCE